MTCQNTDTEFSTSFSLLRAVHGKGAWFLVLLFFLLFLTSYETSHNDC